MASPLSPSDKKDSSLFGNKWWIMWWAYSCPVVTITPAHHHSNIGDRSMITPAISCTNYSSRSSKLPLFPWFRFYHIYHYLIVCDKYNYFNDCAKCHYFHYLLFLTVYQVFQLSKHWTLIQWDYDVWMCIDLWLGCQSLLYKNSMIYDTM